MYTQHPIFIPPDDLNATIWRFMDFTKFVSLLDKNALYFRRLDLFEDRFEGSLPEAPGQVNLSRESLRKFEEIIGHPLPEHVKYTSFHETNRKFAYICSFHLNEHESAALWKIYLKNNEGIAIQTKFNRLCECFEKSEEAVRLGVVNYIDFQQDTIPVRENGFTPFLYKRKSFEHEKELRAAVIFPKQLLPEDSGEETERTEPGPIKAKNINFEIFPAGLNISVNLDLLIENVYVAPTSKEWFLELVQAILNKYGIKRDVKKSSLDSDPVF